MPIDHQTLAAAPETFRALAGSLVTPVAVVVTLAAGEPLATTAGSVVAASWHPPLLAVSFSMGSRMDAALARCGRFTVNVLGEADHGLARRFARPDRERGWASFTGIPLQRRDPSPPIIESALAWADCAVVQAIPIGDHRCYVGEILAMHRDETAAPLAYFRGRLRALGPAIAPAPWTTIDAADLTVVW